MAVLRELVKCALRAFLGSRRYERLVCAHISLTAAPRVGGWRAVSAYASECMSAEPPNIRILRRLAEMAARGEVEVRCEGEYTVVRTAFGEVAVRHGDVGLLSPLTERLEWMYVPPEWAPGWAVVDVGAFIGETPLMYAWRGARAVLAVEPVPKFFEYLVGNAGRNPHGSKIVPVRVGVWVRSGRIEVPVCGASTGLCTERREGTTQIDVVTLGELLKHAADVLGPVDLVKMDCEGCEIAILTEPCETLREAAIYVVETHGHAVTAAVADKMASCGFDAEELVRVEGSPYLSVTAFRRH